MGSDTSGTDISRLLQSAVPVSPAVAAANSGSSKIIGLRTLESDTMRAAKEHLSAQNSSSSTRPGGEHEIIRSAPVGAPIRRPIFVPPKPKLRGVPAAPSDSGQPAIPVRPGPAIKDAFAVRTKNDEGFLDSVLKEEFDAIKRSGGLTMPRPRPTAQPSVPNVSGQPVSPPVPSSRSAGIPIRSQDFPKPPSARVPGADNSGVRVLEGLPTVPTAPKVEMKVDTFVTPKVDGTKSQLGSSAPNVPVVASPSASTSQSIPTSQAIGTPLTSPPPVVASDTPTSPPSTPSFGSIDPKSVLSIPDEISRLEKDIQVIEKDRRVIEDRTAGLFADRSQIEKELLPVMERVRAAESALAAAEASVRAVAQDPLQRRKAEETRFACVEEKHAKDAERWELSARLEDVLTKISAEETAYTDLGKRERRLHDSIHALEVEAERRRLSGDLARLSLERGTAESKMAELSAERARVEGLLRDLLAKEASIESEVAATGQNAGKRSVQEEKAIIDAQYRLEKERHEIQMERWKAEDAVAHVRETAAESEKVLAVLRAKEAEIGTKLNQLG